MYGLLVEYDKDNEEGEDTCPGDGRQLECGRKFVVDCYEVTFLSRHPEEQWNQVVRSTVMGDSVYVTAGRMETAFRNMTLSGKNEDAVMI